MRCVWGFLICCGLEYFAMAQDLPEFRLPNNIVATSYDIRIQPIINNNSFLGEVNIYVKLQTYLHYIALNVNELEIKDLVLDNNVNKTNYTVDEQSEMLFIRYKNNSYINPGEHFIHIEYTGSLRSNSIGLFKSVIESQGKKFVSMATMFSAPYARMVFPCLDEPAYKSRFSIRLVKPDNTFTALSNMAETHSINIADGIAVDFQTTPPISPYLVCFVFTQYNYKSSEYRSIDGRVIPLRFFLLDEYLDQAPFLLEVAKNALRFFENYTKMAYPVSKLDFIEIKDFIYEGMENIGLVILTHNSVSFNSSCGYSKVLHQTNAAQLVVHEISHMWFGDIVTPLWYNDLWLAEGFAQFMELKGLANQYPDWHVQEIHDVFRQNTLFYNEMPPVVKFPENDDQVDAQFGDVTYVKGSAILRMLEMVMGERNFISGIRIFLHQFRMNTATTGDFINIMQAVTPSVNLRGFLETWLYQDDFPQVFVTRDWNSRSYILNQVAYHKPLTHLNRWKKWTIPVTFLSSCNQSSSMTWFDKDADTLKIPSCGEKWIKFNHKAKSFYRMIYTDDQYDEFSDHFNELDEVDQAHLIMESIFPVQLKLISCEVPLKFIAKLKNKEGILPMLAALKVAEWLPRIFQSDTTVHLKLKKFFTETFQHMYQKLKWKVDLQDGQLKRYLRAELIQIFCQSTFTNKDCISDAEKVRLEDGKIHDDLLVAWKEMILYRNKSAIEEGKAAQNLSGKSLANFPIVYEACVDWIKSNL